MVTPSQHPLQNPTDLTVVVWIVLKWLGDQYLIDWANNWRLSIQERQYHQSFQQILLNNIFLWSSKKGHGLLSDRSKGGSSVILLEPQSPEDVRLDGTLTRKTAVCFTWQTLASFNHDCSHSTQVYSMFFIMFRLTVSFFTVCHFIVLVHSGTAGSCFQQNSTVPV